MSNNKMKAYIENQDIFYAMQWFEHGDHPDVIKPTKKNIIEAGLEVDDWYGEDLDNGILDCTFIVKPGDYIFKDKYGGLFAEDKDDFEWKYQKLCKSCSEYAPECEMINWNKLQADEQIVEIKRLLADDKFDSKDWRAGNLINRIEWLLSYHESMKEEIDMVYEMMGEKKNPVVANIPGEDRQPSRQTG